MNKYLNPFAYYYRIRSLVSPYAKKPSAQDCERERKKFTDCGFDRDYALSRLNPILEKWRGSPFDERNDSAHWLVSAALAKAKKPARILEIGTSTGDFTHLLAQLFPTALVHTLDLPDDDPLMRSTYNREQDTAWADFKRKQTENLKLGNIVPHKINSMFLLQALGTEPFDLIWIDGGHLYPEIAWDFAMAFYLLKKDGVMMVDDVLLRKKPYRDQYVSTDSRDLIEYLRKRKDIRVDFLVKRMRQILSGYDFYRDHVAIIRHQA